MPTQRLPKGAQIRGDLTGSYSKRHTAPEHGSLLHGCGGGRNSVSPGRCKTDLEIRPD